MDTSAAALVSTKARIEEFIGEDWTTALIPHCGTHVWMSLDADEADEAVEGFDNRSILATHTPKIRQRPPTLNTRTHGGRDYPKSHEEGSATCATGSHTAVVVPG